MIKTAPYVRLITHSGVRRPENLVDVLLDDFEPLDDGGRDLTMSSQLDLEHNVSLHSEESKSDLSMSNVALKGGDIRFLRIVK